MGGADGLGSAKLGSLVGRVFLFLTVFASITSSSTATATVKWAAVQNNS